MSTQKLGTFATPVPGSDRSRVLSLEAFCRTNPTQFFDDSATLVCERRCDTASRIAAARRDPAHFHIKKILRPER